MSDDVKPEVFLEPLSDPVEEEILPPEPEPEPYVEPPLNEEELIEVRWVLFGKCPVCHAYIKDWSPGPFNARRYQDLQSKGIDALSGHMQTCNEKWRRH